jgi:hypothetical protein
MKILNIIIANFLPGVYSDLVTEWKRYMNSNPEIRSLFIVYDSTISSLYTLTENTLTIRGEDSYVPGIYEKTIFAIKVCLSLPEFSNVEYVIRTNLSSFWIWNRLIKFLDDKPKTGYVSTGHIMDVFNVLAPHGSNFIMSRDIALKFSEDYDVSEKFTHPDDVMFGFLCKKHNITINKYNWCVSSHIINPDEYPEFIRCIGEEIFTIRNNLLDPVKRTLYEGKKYKMLVDTFYA